MKMQSSLTKYKVYPLVMNINVKSTSYKRTHQKFFKKLNSWATGTVKYGCSLLQQFLENTELYFSFGMLSLSCKMFSEKKKTTRLNGRDAMPAALTINSMLFLLTVCRKWLGSFLLTTELAKSKYHL